MTNKLKTRKKSGGGVGKRSGQFIESSRQMKAAESVVRRYRNTLRELAKHSDATHLESC